MFKSLKLDTKEINYFHILIFVKVKINNDNYNTLVFLENMIKTINKI